MMKVDWLTKLSISLYVSYCCSMTNASCNRSMHFCGHGYAKRYFSGSNPSTEISFNIASI